MGRGAESSQAQVKSCLSGSILMASEGSHGDDPGLCYSTITDDEWQLGGSGKTAASLWVEVREI